MIAVRTMLSVCCGEAYDPSARASSFCSSPGFEDFSAPFLKYAYPGDEKDKNVIVPYLANLFHVALSEKRIPACREKAKISPLYKKGSKLDPDNYRMLAVTGLCIDSTPIFWKN